MPAAKKDYTKIAGRFILGRIAGTELDDVTKKCLTDGTIGGIVLFKENAESLEQLSRLCAEIIDTSHHPPIIAVDQEGGAIQRFEHILTPLPSQMALAASQKEEFVEQCAQINARQCKKVGINCLLTPVMDVITNNLNPIVSTRSFSGTAQQVALWSKLVLKAIAAEGITPVGKHFPGHGSTLEDSHLALAVNPSDETAIWKSDLMPFRECMSELPALMVGHIWVKSIDEEPLPATLSDRIINRVLRGYFEYDGIVMTDDMTMKALADKWGVKEAAVMALEAGVDVLMVCSTPKETLAVSQHVGTAIKSGKISEHAVDQANRRLNKRFGKRLKPPTKADLKELREDINRSTELTLTASAASISLLTRYLPQQEPGSESLVEPARGTWRNPITSGEWHLVVPKHPRYPLGLLKFLNELAVGAEDPIKCTATFSEVRYSLDPTEQEATTVAKQCAGKNCIFLTYRAMTNSGQVILANKLKEKAAEVVMVACETPFDITVISCFKHILATFDPSELAMRGLSCVLLSIIEPFGVSPVDLQVQTVEHK